MGHWLEFSSWNIACSSGIAWRIYLIPFIGHLWAFDFTAYTNKKKSLQYALFNYKQLH